jgi:hypothetical protein
VCGRGGRSLRRSASPRGDLNRKASFCGRGCGGLSIGRYEVVAGAGSAARVCGLWLPNFGNSGNDLPGHTDPSAGVVPRHVVADHPTVADGDPRGAVSHEHLEYYLDEFTFRFNRRRSKSRGKMFFRLVHQAVAVASVPLDRILHPEAKAKTKPQSVGAT